ncbi:MAG TPA: hypothetical protein VK689_02380, partial [Armatimonadota bacterium]|nr:hypothetical protein [Armatimonadota bacterium]
MGRAGAFPLFAAALLTANVLLTGACQGRASAAPISGPAVLRAIPSLTGPDVDGVTRSLTDYRGRPVALFFYCGCQACHDSARIWGRLQRADASAAGGAKESTPVTLVVFAGE